MTRTAFGFTRLEIPGGYLTFGNRELFREDNTGTGGQDGGEWTRNITSHFYVTDYLGSVMAVCSGETGAVEQTMDYLPSGTVFRATNYGKQPRRFCGKEEMTQHSWNMYDSNARYQYARLPRFSTMDPLAENYYHLSPYNYAENDFVNKIDPSGLDAYIYDSTGRLIDTSIFGIWRYQDCFVVVGEDGFLKWGPVYDLGTVIDHRENKFHESYKGGGGGGRDYGMYRFSDADKGRKVYEFLAKNTSSEWSFYIFSDNDSYMFSSFDSNMERAGSYFLYQYTGNVRLQSLTHSHPDNVEYPSGLYKGPAVSTNENMRKPDNDMKQLNWFVNTFGYEPDFFIFIPATGTYLPYSSKSREKDYRSLVIDAITSGLPF